MRSRERDVFLYKFGRAIESTYEALRRLPLDRAAIEISLIANQVEVDKLAVILDVILNGDGNAGTAMLSYNLSDLDPAAPLGKPTLEAWLEFKLRFENPYMLTTLIGQRNGIIKAMLINTGTANVPLVVVAPWIGVGGFRPINNSLGDDVRYGVTNDAPSLKWIGLDKRRAIEQVYEIGANITEMERFATRQTETLVMTETVGYAKMDKRATKGVNLNA